MGSLVEDLIAGGVVLLVGGAILGIVFRLVRGTKREDDAMNAIAKKYGSAKNTAAKKK